MELDVCLSSMGALFLLHHEPAVEPLPKFIRTRDRDL